ncbi:hypothetical protein Q3304_08785 [Clostridioides sp. GD02377]|uniref:hypothetical protein n=1 Tax=unclassified Clostridioides TaxID=2635829 RepID=UPI0038A98876
MICISNIDSELKKEIFFIKEKYRRKSIKNIDIESGINLSIPQVYIQDGHNLASQNINIQNGYLLEIKKVSIKKGKDVLKETNNIKSESDDNFLFNKKNIIYKKGMSIREFLKQNPDKRLEKDVLEYFSSDEIQDNLKKCKIFKKHGKLII